MPSRFVRPETRLLTLANGDTLTVRKRLTAGEQRAAYARMYVTAADGRLQRDPLQTSLGMLTAYLLDWSLKDDDGKSVTIDGLSVDALQRVLDNLSPEDFTEIRDAVEKHEDEMRAERASKKTRGGVTESAATSPSHSAATGPSTPSETLTLTTTTS